MAEENIVNQPPVSPPSQAGIQSAPPFPPPPDRPPDGPPPSPAEHDPLWKLAVTLVLQLVLGVVFGLLTCLIMIVAGSEPSSALGWGLVMVLVGFFASRSLLPASLAGHGHAPAAGDAGTQGPPPSEVSQLLRW